MQLAARLLTAFLSLTLAVLQTGTTRSAETAGPAKASPPVLTAEGYRDLIVTTADSVYLLRTGVIKGMQALQSTPVCVLTLDTEKQKLAAQSTAAHRETWANARVSKALEASHAEVLSWIKRAESQFKDAPDCMYGGSLPLLTFFGTFGSYDGVRKNAATALGEVGVDLPPLAKPTN